MIRYLFSGTATYSETSSDNLRLFIRILRLARVILKLTVFWEETWLVLGQPWYSATSPGDLALVTWQLRLVRNWLQRPVLVQGHMDPSNEGLTRPGTSASTGRPVQREDQTNEDLHVLQALGTVCVGTGGCRSWRDSSKLGHVGMVDLLVPPYVVQ